jgi:hypothetical protein
MGALERGVWPVACTTVSIYNHSHAIVLLVLTARRLSIFLVNIWQVLAGCAPNFGSIIVARALVCYLLLQLSRTHVSDRRT